MGNYESENPITKRVRERWERIYGKVEQFEETENGMYIINGEEHDPADVQEDVDEYVFEEERE